MNKKDYRVAIEARIKSGICSADNNQYVAIRIQNKLKKMFTERYFKKLAKKYKVEFLHYGKTTDDSTDFIVGFHKC